MASQSNSSNVPASRGRKTKTPTVVSAPSTSASSSTAAKVRRRKPKTPTVIDDEEPAPSTSASSSTAQTSRDSRKRKPAGVASPKGAIKKPKSEFDDSAQRPEHLYERCLQGKPDTGLTIINDATATFNIVFTLLREEFPEKKSSFSGEDFNRVRLMLSNISYGPKITSSKSDLVTIDDSTVKIGKFETTRSFVDSVHEAYEVKHESILNVLQEFKNRRFVHGLTQYVFIAMVFGTMKARSDQGFLDVPEYAQFIAGCLFIFRVFFKYGYFPEEMLDDQIAKYLKQAKEAEKEVDDSQVVSLQKSADVDENGDEQRSSSEDKVEEADDDDVDYSIIPFRLLGTTGNILEDSLKNIIGCMDDGLIVFNLAPSILEDVEQELTAQLAVINGSKDFLETYKKHINGEEKTDAKKITVVKKILQELKAAKIAYITAQEEKKKKGKAEVSDFTKLTNAALDRFFKVRKLLEKPRLYIVNEISRAACVRPCEDDENPAPSTSASKSAPAKVRDRKPNTPTDIDEEPAAATSASSSAATDDDEEPAPSTSASKSAPKKGRGGRKTKTPTVVDEDADPSTSFSTPAPGTSRGGNREQKTKRVKKNRGGQIYLACCSVQNCTHGSGIPDGEDGPWFHLTKSDYDLVQEGNPFFCETHKTN